MSGIQLTIKDLASFHQEQDISLNEQQLEQLGGLAGLEKKLATDFSKGLRTSESDMSARRKAFGRNEFPEPESATWFSLFVESFEDTTIIVLVVAAVVSFAVGMYEDPAKGWIEGAAILSAVLIVAIVTATNNYNKEQQFRKLNAVKDDVSVQVVRDGAARNVGVRELVVGDMVLLNAGDRIPADGLLVDGSDVTVNESSLTGESDDKKKGGSGGGEECDVFLLSGTTLSTGFAKQLVTAVGEQSRWGRTKALLAAESTPTPLQDKLDVLASQIGHFGMLAAVLTFGAMLGLWFLRPDWREEGVALHEYVLKAFIMGVTIVVVAVPEGLPLAVTLSLAYSTQKMMADNNLIRVLAACETMGNATTICSDKTGTLTQNRMTVVTAFIAGQLYGEAQTQGFDALQAVDKRVTARLCEGAAVNSTANVVFGDVPTVTGSKTEGALLLFAKDQLGADYVPLRQHFNAARGDRLLTFSSARKRMSVVLLDQPSGGATCHTKGASEIVLSLCNRITTTSGAEEALTEARRRDILQIIDKMAKSALRTVAIAHRVLPKLSDSDGADEIERDLVLDAIVGIKDPLRPDVPEAVRRCQAAGIFVRMVTGDNVETAKAIAKECGILTDGGVAMEGPDFRRLTPAQLDEVLPKLQVLARSSPDDKHTLVTRLNGKNLPDSPEAWLAAHAECDYENDKDKLLPGYLQEWTKSRLSKGCVGEVVGVTGDGTNDGPALKAADVGLSMGMSGTDVAKEASDIVILDDNFSSIVKSVLWGRAVFDNIRKFLQFQLTVNVVALTLTFLSALSGKEPPLNAVMMLWVNLIMDTLGALALGTEPPSQTLLARRPYKRDASLISRKMIRNILVQFLFQMAVLSFLLLRGAQHFGAEAESREHLTIIFNTFVFCQVFNELNARSIGDDINVFLNLHRNVLFLGILLFTAVAQVFIVQYGGEFVRTVPLSAQQWQKCITLGALSLPLGGLMRLLPVADSEDNFATLSPLMQAGYAKEKEKREAAQRSQVGQGVTASFFVWLAVAGAIPLLAWQQFADVTAPA